MPLEEPLDELARLLARDSAARGRSRRAASPRPGVADLRPGRDRAQRRRPAAPHQSRSGRLSAAPVSRAGDGAARVCRPRGRALSTLGHQPAHRRLSSDAVLLVLARAASCPTACPATASKHSSTSCRRLRGLPPHLPEGIEAVLRQGTAVDAGQRFTAPAGFLAAPAEAVAQRAPAASLDGAGPLGDRPAHPPRPHQGGTAYAPTRTRCWSARSRSRSAPWSRSPTASRRCDVGSGAARQPDRDHRAGERASTADAARRRLPRRRSPSSAAAARQTLLDWALEKGYREQLAHGRDLMGTTLTAGWLEGRELMPGQPGR